MSAIDNANWRALFDAALDAANGNRETVGKQLGVSRTTVSLVAANKYHARSDAFAKRVIDTYGGIDCPHLGTRISGVACKGFALRAAPTSSTREARHWRACQTCPNRPSSQTISDSVTEVKP